MRLSLSLLLLVATLLISCGQDGQQFTGGPAPGPGPQPTPPPAGPGVVALDLSPATATLARQTSQRFVVTGVYADGTTQDLTAVAELSSSSPTVAAVRQPGLVHGVGPGQATLTASVAGATARAEVTVTNAALRSLQITQPSATLARDTAEQLVATGVFDDGTTQDLSDQVTWSSSTPALSVDAEGLATASSPAPSVRVTATFLGVTGSTTLEVTPASLVYLDVDPSFAEVTKGTTIEYRATGTFSDNTTQDLTRAVDWTSSVPAVVTVNENGEARTVGTGEATIQARAGQFRAPAGVFVKPATLDLIRVSRPQASLAKGTFVQLDAVGVYSDGTTVNITDQVAWVAGSPAVAISNAPGSRGRAFGAQVAANVDVSALLAGINGTTSLSVTPAVLTTLAVSGSRPLAKGTTLQLGALGTYSDGTTQDLTASAAWSTVNPAVATVTSPGGLVRAVEVGTTGVIAVWQGVRGTAPLEVTAAALQGVEMAPRQASLKPGQGVAFGVTARYSDGSLQNVTRQAEWSSSDPQVAEVSNAVDLKGQAFANRGGQVTVTALFGGQRTTANLTVTATQPRVYVSNRSNGTISAYTLGDNGALTAVPGSPFAAASVLKLSGAPDGHFLYAAGRGVLGFAVNQFNGGLAPLPGSPYGTAEFEDVTAAAAGFVYSVATGVQGWRVEPASGALTPLGLTPAGRFPVSVATDGRFLYTANRSDFNVSGFALDATGGLTPVPGSPFSTGDRPAAFQVIVDPRGRFVYTAHLTAEIIGFTIGAGGTLRAMPFPFFSGGNDPTLAMSPAGTFLYAANREARHRPTGIVTSLTVRSDGDLGEITSNNLEVNGPTGVAVDPTGRFVYACNEGGNSVSAWSIRPDGTLAVVPGSPFPAGPGPSGIVVLP